MSILADVKTELESPDAVTGRAYQFFQDNITKTIGFIELKSYLGVNHAQVEKALRILRGANLIRQVGFDQKSGSKRGGPVYRAVSPNEYVLGDVVLEVKTEMVINNAISVALGHEEWCMITSPKNARCTCKVKKQPTPTAPEVELKNVTPIPEPTPPKVPWPGGRVSALDAKAKRIITEGEVLTILQTMQEATSLEIASLLEVEGREQTNRVSMLCSSLFAQNLVGRSQRRNAGNGAFLYYMIPNALAKDRVVTEIVTRPTIVETVTINDPYRALYMKSLYKRIVSNEPLNDEDRQALALALGVAEVVAS